MGQVNVTEERLEMTAHDRASGAIDKVQGAYRSMRSELDATRAAIGALGATIGVGAIVAFGKQALDAAMQAEQASTRLNAVVRATGNSAAFSRGQLDGMADALARTTQFDDEGIRNAQAQLLKFGNIHGNVFGEALKLSTDLAAFMGTQVPEAAQMIGKSLQSPTEGLQMMERQFGKLRPEQEKMINDLVRQGKAVEAQNAVLEIWRSKIGGVAQEMNTGLTKATSDAAKAWNELLEAIGKTETARSGATGTLGSLTTYLTKWKELIENGTWYEKLINLLTLVSPGQAIGRAQSPLGLTDPSTIERREMEALQSQRRGLTAIGGPQRSIDAIDARIAELMAAGEIRAGSGIVDPAKMPKTVLGGNRPKTQEELELERERARLRALAAKSAEEDLRAQQEIIDANDELIRQAVERGKRERERLDKLGEESAIKDLLAQQARLEERDELERIGRLKEREERERALLKQQEEARKVAKEHAEEARRAWERTANSIENALANAIMRGGEGGLQLLMKALRTELLMPIIAPLAKALAGMIMGAMQSGMSSVMGMFGASAPGYFGGMFGGGATGAAGAGAAGGAAAAGGLSAIPVWGWIAAAALAASSPRGPGNVLATGYNFQRRFLDTKTLTGIDPIGAYFSGEVSFENAWRKHVDPLGLVLDWQDGDAMRRAGYSASFGAVGEYTGRKWWSGSVWEHATPFAEAQAQAEQNLIQRLNLSPDQIASVNQALAFANRDRHDFGMEHTDVRQSGAFEKIAAQRLEAISKTLGRSIEELTSIMGMSAEQWQEAVDTLKRALEDAERNAKQFARALPEQLGITGLESFRDSLATSEAVAPLERLAASRSQYDALLGRALGGDLDAVRAFPDAAQNLLGISRDVYASGGDFQNLFREVNFSLGQVLERQRAEQADLMSGLEFTMAELSRNEIDELRAMKNALVSAMNDVKTELQRMQAA